MAGRKKKKGNLPSKEEAELAMESIKAIQKVSDENELQKQQEEEARARREALEYMNKKMALEAQEKIKKKLKENLLKKQKSDKEKTLKVFLESGNKIKWKSINNGNKLQGYFDDKFVFEISRGLNLFSLYIKDKKIMQEKKLPSYIGCSVNLQKLKQKSEKII